MEGRSTCIGRRIRKNSDQQTLHKRSSTSPHPSHHQTRWTTSPAWVNFNRQLSWRHKKLVLQQRSRSILPTWQMVGPTAKKLNLTRPAITCQTWNESFYQSGPECKRSDPDPVRHWDLHSPPEVRPCGRELSVSGRQIKPGHIVTLQLLIHLKVIDSSPRRKSRNWG